MTLDLTRIGQIGLGYMGASLAERLRDLGKTAIGHDIDAGKMRCMFASNFPVDSLIADYRTILSASMSWPMAVLPRSRSRLARDPPM